MIQYLITFSIVQLMFLAVALFGGVEFGTLNAGGMCFLSQVIGVVACIVEYNFRGKYK